MNLYAVIPNESAPKNLNALFSTLDKALEFVKRKKCSYQVNVFEAEVKGDYRYPNEVCLVKKYPSDISDAKVSYIPDSQEQYFIKDRCVMKKDDITNAIKKTIEQIRTLCYLLNC